MTIVALADTQGYAATLLNTASAFVRHGFSIFPIRFREKRPAIPSWLPYQSRVADASELQSWFGDGHPSNLAIVCGKVSGNLVVLDFDNELAFENFRDVVPDLEERTKCVKTGKGHHVYMRFERPVPIMRDHEFGLDVQGEGAYVVAPPSVHPSGRTYEWENPRVRKVETFDTRWLAGIFTALGLHLTTAAKREEAQRAGAAPVKGQDNWISSLLLAGKNEGGRNAALADLMGYFRHRVPYDIGLSIGTLFGERCSPPLDLDEITRTVQSIYRYGGPTVEEEHERTRTLCEAIGL